MLTRLLLYLISFEHSFLVIEWFLCDSLVIARVLSTNRKRSSPWFFIIITNAVTFIEHSLFDSKGPRCVSRVVFSQEPPPPPSRPLAYYLVGLRDSLLNHHWNSEFSGLSYPKAADARGLAVDPMGEGFFAVTE